MDLKELRSFFHIARLRSFSRAAAELRIAQPALSRRIQKLEEELGAPLLIRHAKGVELTSAGEIVFKQAEALIGAVLRIKESVRAGAGAIDGRLRMALPPAAGAILLGPLLRKFQNSYPSVSLHILEGVGQTLHDWLRTGYADAVIMHNPPPLKMCRVEPLLHEALCIIGSSSIRRPENFDTRDLEGLKLVLPAYPHFARLLVEQIAVQHGFGLTIAVEVDGPGLMGDLVTAGLGHGVATFASVARRVERGDLWAIPFSGRKLYSTVAVGYRDGEALSPALAVFLEELHQIIPETVSAGLWPGEVHLATTRPTET